MKLSKREIVTKAVRRGKSLAGANLSRANLFGANLHRADLSGVNLFGANLYRADLSGANLSEVNLFEANLSGANLSGAKDIFQFGPIGTLGRICYAIKHKNCIMIKAGCYWDTIDALEELVKDDPKREDYKQIIPFIRSKLGE